MFKPHLPHIPAPSPPPLHRLSHTYRHPTVASCRSQNSGRLDDVTTVEVLDHLVSSLDIDRPTLKKLHKKQIDQRLIKAYGQMIPPSQLGDKLYLGSEWNATNLDELQALGVRHVVNCTLEHDVGGVPSPFKDQITYLRLEQLDNIDATLIKVCAFHSTQKKSRPPSQPKRRRNRALSTPAQGQCG